MGIYVDKRAWKDGSTQFRFTYIDRDGKRKRIPSSKHPKFSTLVLPEGPYRGYESQNK